MPTFIGYAHAHLSVANRGRVELEELGEHGVSLFLDKLRFLHVDKGARRIRKVRG